MIRFIVGGLLAYFSLLGGYVLEGGNPMNLWGLSSFIINFLGPWFAVLTVWSWKDWTSAIGHVFKRAETPAAAGVSVAIWKASEFFCYAFGFGGFFLGAVLIFGNIEGADMARLGHSVSAAMISPFYSVSLGAVSRLLRLRVENLSH